MGQEKKSSIPLNTQRFPRCKLECIQIHCNCILHSGSFFFLSSNLWPVISVIQVLPRGNFHHWFQFFTTSRPDPQRSNYAKLIFCPFLFLGKFDKAFPLAEKSRHLKKLAWEGGWDLKRKSIKKCAIPWTHWGKIPIFV